MQVTFEITHRALARRVVTEGDVNVGIDQARNRGHAAGVDHDVARFDLGRRWRDTDMTILPVMGMIVSA